MDIVFAPHTQVYIKINIIYVTLERADETSYMRSCTRSLGCSSMGFDWEANRRLGSLDVEETARGRRLVSTNLGQTQWQWRPGWINS